MAICRGALELWRMLKEDGVLPARPSVLEIGEANWYGDVDALSMPEFEGVDLSHDPFVLAKQFYHVMLRPISRQAIDMNGSTAIQWDLNQPLVGVYQYDIVINTGTTEHVFNQCQVFRSIHDHTTTGGLMVHCFPVGGCTDHGFYTYSPCLVRELARANEYQLLAGVESTLGQDKLVHLAWKKTSSVPFVIPQQRESKGVTGGEFRRVS